MLKENSVAFIGVGQCGGNIARELKMLDCNVYYVNTSLEDLYTVQAEPTEMYHIPDTKGMAKDIAFAKEVIENNDECGKIAETIYKKYANANIYYFIFSSAGGTGSGMSPYIMKAMKEIYPDKIINAVTTLPNDEEDMVLQYNSIKCMEHLRKLVDEGVITNIQILDNNKRDFNRRNSINKEFASFMNTLVTFQSDSTEGNLDEEEIERLFSSKGVTVISEFDTKDFLEDLANVDENTMYAPFGKDPKALGLILNKDINNITTMQVIKESFGIPIATHYTTWDEDANIVISCGLSFNDNIINKLSANYKGIMKKREEIKNNNAIEKTENIELDFTEMDSFSKTNQKTPAKPRERRRGLGVNGESKFRR